MLNNPTAIYRLQVTSDFDLYAAAKITSYLNRLGASHVYTSPILQAARGSTHGYDVVNPHQVNQDLGGRPGLEALEKALHTEGLGYILDIVPNHMAVSEDNPWWWDVLENGPSSQYASYFDVEWDPPEARHSNAVLVPILGDHYGRVLEAGELQLKFENGRFLLHYYDNVLPVNPRSLGILITRAAERSNSDFLAFMGGAYARLPLATATDRIYAQRRHRDQVVLHDLLVQHIQMNPEIEKTIQGVVSDLNADPDDLGRFLDFQNYRLAFWRITERELGYRRFFDINTLIGLRMEDEEVFQDTHALVINWMRRGLLDGLRIDHPDGMRDPGGYFQQLHIANPQTWIVAEKILEEDEELLDDWPIAGTTGYDFLNRLNGLFIDPEGEQLLTQFYQVFSGQTEAYESLVYQNKRNVIEDLLGSDLNRLVALMMEIIEDHRRYRDYTRNELREALSEIAANLPVYRTYVRAKEGIVHEQDVHYVNQTVEKAQENCPEIGSALFDFLRDLLLLRIPYDTESELIMRFQQFTGPVMAKGVEDTTFYQYNRLVSLNEVGGDPGRFGVSAEEFHQACQKTLQHQPQTMMTTSTHDTKRSEDVRARINLLSEIPEIWAEAVQRWSEQNESLRENNWPDRNTEYLIYQTLVGAWPISLDRMLAYMEKATREAKVWTSWIRPDQPYENAVGQFIQGIYSSESLMNDMETFIQPLIEAGRTNSLSQTLIKLTSPGIPDIYQGTEIWDLSLVDPDNRHLVDFDLRQSLLKDLEAMPAPEEILARMDEGLPKMWVIRQALKIRADRPELFGPNGDYQPLPVDGKHGIAFQRGQDLVVIAPRFVYHGVYQWGRTTVAVPEGRWRNVLTGEVIESGLQNLEQLLQRFPVSLLLRQEG